MARRNTRREGSGLRNGRELKEYVQPQVRLGSGGLKGPSQVLSKSHAALFSIGLFVLVVAAFFPALRNGFVNFDDNLYLLDNAHASSGFTWQSIRWAFSNLQAGFWHPLTWLSILADSEFYGLQARGHHLTSVLLHAASTVVLFLALQRMTRLPWRSVFVAGLFGLHPLHVESVAWVSERKDVLSGFFWMLALLLYVRYAQQPRSGKPLPAQAHGTPMFHLPSSIFYLLSLFFFLCGLMSKPIVATLPLIFILLDWWPLGRTNFDTPRATLKGILALIREKVPFLAAALVCGVVTVYAETGVGALGTATGYPLTGRVENASLSYLTYLRQTLWPTGLAVFYPYPEAFPAWRAATAGLVCLLISALVLWARRKRPYLVVGWVWYVVTLLPVIGLIQVGDFSRADRFTYLPLIGVFLALTWGACELTRRWRYQVMALSLAGSAVIVLCLALTWQQLGHWQDSETLFRHALAVTENNDLAHNNLGLAVEKAGQVDEAISQFKEAVRLKPRYPEAHYNLANALARKGEAGEAIRQYKEAIRLKPDYTRAHNNLGIELAKQGQIDEAIRQFQETIRLKPDYVDAHNNLGNAFARTRQLSEAVLQFHEAVRLKPDYALSHNNLGMALAEAGQIEEAIRQFQEALRLKPDYPQASNNLARGIRMRVVTPVR